MTAGPEGGRSVRNTLRNRIPAITGLAFLIGSGIAIHYTGSDQAQLTGIFSDAARASLRDPSITGILLGGAAFSAWLILAISFGFILFAACLLVEIALEGSPRSWGGTAGATGLQAVAMGYVLLIAPLVSIITPDAWGFGPLLSVTHRHLPDVLSPAAPVLLALLSLFVLNFAQYWTHRAQHAVPWLWRFHAVHHSVREMDSMNSYTHPVDSLGWQLAHNTLLALIVVDYQMMVWIGGMIVIHDRLLHTRAQVNFGIFHHVLIDNRHHFVHHSADSRDFNKNFSAWFTFWDKVFGTYSPPRDITGISTGLAGQMPPRSIWQFLSGKLSRPPVRQDEVGR